MNEQLSTQRLIADSLARAGVTPPSGAVDEILSTAGRMRPLPRWLALIKEPPMRLSSSLAVGSPAARVAAIMVATLLLAIAISAAGIAGSRLLAADGPIVVAQDGSGTYTTIKEAVEAAEDGDTILVKPGTYVEAIVIDKDITLTGDGPREDIVIASDGSGTPIIRLTDSDALLSELTVTGDDSQVHVSGGAPVLDGLLFDAVGKASAAALSTADDAVSLYLADTRARVTGNTFRGGGGIGVGGGSTLVIDGNELSDGPMIVLTNVGAGTVVRANTIRDVVGQIGIRILSPGSPLVEGNTIIGVPLGGIVAVSPGSDPVIRGNTISGTSVGILLNAGTDAMVEDNAVTDSVIGIDLMSRASGTITGNDLADNHTGIASSATDAVLDGNSVRGGSVGISIQGTGSPTLKDNTIEEAETGLFIGNLATPTLVGNNVCGNGTNLTVFRADMPDTAGNTLCEDVATR